MTTAADLVNETLGLLVSYTQNSDQVTTLNGNMSPTDLTFPVTTIRSGILGLSPGLCEIDTEQVYVTSIDSASNSATVAPWGRGQNGTTAVSHSAGAKVTSQPTFPRAAILNALNETIGRCFPEIFVPKVTTLTVTYPSRTYDLPEDAQWVLDARWRNVDPGQTWVGIRKWRDSNGGTTVAGDPGRSVDVYDSMLPGRPIEFTYAAAPSLFAAESDNYTVSGLPTSLRDVLVYGAASTLVTSQELSRLQIVSVEQQQRSPLVAPSAALQSSNYLEQRYLRRLQEEIASLRRKWPLRLHGSWI